MNAAPAAPVQPPKHRRPRWAAIAAVPVALVVAGLIAVLAVSKQATDTAQSPLVGRAAPPIEGQLLDAATGSLRPGRYSMPRPPGKWLLVNFFASWCVPCREEAPELRKWAQAHETANDAELVQVIFQESPLDSAAFLRSKGGATWPVVVGDSGQIALDWGVSKIPETFLIAPGGTVVLKTIAPVTQAWLDSQIASFGKGAP